MKTVIQAIGHLSVGLSLMLIPFGCDASKDMGKTGGKDSHSSKRVDLKRDSQNNLRNIGTAYSTALTTEGRVKGMKELKQYLERGSEKIFTSPVDEQPYEIVFNVDLSRAADRGNLLIAWEKTGDTEGGRNVLKADFSVAKLSPNEFEEAPKAGK